MVSKQIISKNLDNCLDDTSFLSIPGRKKGKVRDSYDLGDKILLITTDRQSAFDRILASIPFTAPFVKRACGGTSFLQGTRSTAFSKSFMI